MDNEATVSNALDSRFFAPLRRRRTRRVGVELEFPVWNRTPGTATDFSAIHEAADDFLSQFPFSAQVRDDNGAIYRATDPATRDELSFDCSYNTLELSFGPDEDINATHRRFARYYGALQETLGRPEDRGKLRKLLSFTGSDRDVADPWYTGDFDETYSDVLAGCLALLKQLPRKGTSAE